MKSQKILCLSTLYLEHMYRFITIIITFNFYPDRVKNLYKKLKLT